MESLYTSWGRRKGDKIVKKTLYIDMDGVINLFEEDPKARENMWTPGYFKDGVNPRENIQEDLLEVKKYFDELFILTKCIDRVGVAQEKIDFCTRYFPIYHPPILFVPYPMSKRAFIDPDSFTVLLDDNPKNLSECEGIANICVLFDEYGKYFYKNRIFKFRDILRYVR